MPRRASRASISALLKKIQFLFKELENVAVVFGHDLNLRLNGIPMRPAAGLDHQLRIPCTVRLQGTCRSPSMTLLGFLAGYTSRSVNQCGNFPKSVCESPHSYTSEAKPYPQTSSKSCRHDRCRFLKDTRSSF